MRLVETIMILIMIDGDHMGVIAHPESLIMTVALWAHYKSRL